MKGGDIMGFGKDQKIFIMKKVEKLGSTEKVKRLYNKDCTVDNFAVAYAMKLFGKIKRTPTK